MTLDYLESVQASAGTGKTFTLAQRVLEEIVGGVSIDRIVVVTFTVAATASLKTKVRARLRDALQGLRARDAGAPWTPPDDVLGRWVRGAGSAAVDGIQQALVDFDLAAISTIHSFCSRLLVTCAFEAGASLSNTEGSAAAEAAERVVVDELRRLTTQQSALFVRALDTAGFSHRSLTELAKKAQERDVVALPEPVEPVGDAPDLAPFEQALALVREVASQRSLDETFVDNPALVGRRSSNYAESFPGKGTRDDIDALLKWLAGPNLLAPVPTCADRFTVEFIAAATRAGHAPPVHPVVERLAVLRALHASVGGALRSWATRLRRELVRRIRVATLEEARRRDERSFEDLLRQVRDSAGAVAFKRAVEDRWDLAMVDEFQDTDPVQWAVFKELFAGKRLLVVGDPKQSIYAFRRADVHSYVAAVNSAGKSSPLRTNFRSDQRLLKAVGRLFDGPMPFATPDIQFEKVDAHHQDNRLGDDRAPLDIRHIQRPTDRWHRLLKHGAFNQWNLARVCVEEVAEEIVRELSSHSATPSMCAVLTRTNGQASQVRDALRRRGVPVVLRTADTAFQSPVAKALHAILGALHAPGDHSAVAQALATPLMGRTGQDLVDLKATPVLWAQSMTAMRRWNATWREEGVLAALEQWAQEDRVLERILSRPGGGRTAADLRHLFALLHRAEFEERRAPAGLLAWFSAGGPGTDEELAAQRVESDDDAVQISTIHKAKGLEYDRVWLPFAWMPTYVGTADGDVPRYWDAEGARWVLDVRVPTLPVATAAMETDKLREDLRQIYVAVTRARHRCVIYWGPAGTESAMGYLLHRGRDAATVEDLRTSASARVRRDSDIQEDLNHLAQHAQISAGGWDPTGSIETTRWTEKDPVHPDSLTVRTRKRSRPLDTWWRRVSYSSLTRGQDLPARQEVPREDRDDDAVDADASDGDGLDEARVGSDGGSANGKTGPEPSGGPTSGAAGTSGAARVESQPTGLIPLAELEGGSHVGDTVHDALEHHDLQASETELRTLVARYAAAHGVDAAAVPLLSESLHGALRTPLFDDGFTLSDLPWSQTLREPSFALPVRGGYDPSSPLSAQQLSRGFDEPLSKMVAGLGFLPVTGFLEGRLDLIFEREGRFYLLDWKSNRLGPRWSDYAAGRLSKVMWDRGYLLQAELYALALHRLLKQRLGPTYDFEAHFGEVIYAFVRGMVPEHGSGHGVWRRRPTLAGLERLESVLERRAP